MRDLKSSVWAQILLWLGIFIIALLLRTARLTNTGALWVTRAESFYAALQQGDWASTYQRRHPGVTTMAIGAASFWAYEQLDSTPAANLLLWSVPPDTSAERIREVLPVTGIALISSLLLVAIGLTLKKLGGWHLALIGTGLLVLSPYLLALTRVTHVDALASAFMLLSGLLLLLSLQEKTRLYFVLSGLVGGVSVLTKVPAVFLIPFTGLTLLSYAGLKVKSEWYAHSADRLDWLARLTMRDIVMPLLAWIALAAIPFAFWPAMWVNPRGVIEGIFLGVSERVENPHGMRHFFHDRIYASEEMGLKIYGVFFVMLLTGVSMALNAFALGMYTLWRKRITLPVPPVMYWLMLAYIGFFIIEMSLGARQAPRYLMPALVMAEITAAVGAAALINLVRRAWPSAAPAARAAWLIPLAVIALQASESLPYAPDYGAHHNLLLGGNQVAVRWIEVSQFEEGIFEAVAYLNDQPDAAAQTIQIARPGLGVLAKSMKGTLTSELTPDADYYLFNIDTMQRKIYVDQWKPLYNSFEGQDAALTVTFDGVSFIQLYAGEDTQPAEPVVIRRGGVGLIALAWAGALALIATVVFSLRRLSARQPEARPFSQSGSKPLQEGIK
jgi:4-amino-4-deoxy-L-arabinose transferase-like glycosyltransferase